ncbi:hypothetical protein ACQ4PT_033990 [Festuca glaucescens]
MAELERRLQHALVASVGGDRPAVSYEQVCEALTQQLGIPASRFSVHEFQLEDFLLVMATAELKSKVLSVPFVAHGGFALFVRPWTRLAQASKVNMHCHVNLVLEGIPPHAWEREIAELLGTSCVIEELGPVTRARKNLSLFHLSSWTDNPEAIPPARTLVIPEPEELDAASSEIARRHREEIAMLRYKLLIHIDSLEEDIAQGELGLRDGAPGSSDQRGKPPSGWSGGVGRTRHSIPW